MHCLWHLHVYFCPVIQISKTNRIDQVLLNYCDIKKHFESISWTSRNATAGSLLLSLSLINMCHCKTRGAAKNRETSVLTMGWVCMRRMALLRKFSCTSLGSSCRQAEFENDETGFGRTPSSQHLKGDDGLVKVEPSVGALLKPAESDCSSLVPTKPVRNLNFVTEEDETSLLAWWRWSTSSGSTSTLST